MSPTSNLSVAYDRDQEIQDTIDALKYKSDAKNRLPATFINVAAETITHEEMGYAYPPQTAGWRQQDREREIAAEKVWKNQFKSRVASLTADFMKSGFISLDDSQPDIHNGGQLLKVSVYVDEAPISDVMKPAIRDAINEKIRWMGYEQDKTSNCITMKYPGYGR